MSARRFGLGCALAAAGVALAGCHLHGAGKDGKRRVPSPAAAATDLDCFPEDARPWIATDVANAGPTDRTLGPVSIYVDHSGSMAGYVRAETGDTQPFQDLIATIPGVLGIDSGGVRRVLFGKGLQEVPADRADDLLKEGTYSCRDVPKGCDNQESRLDLALAAIAAEGKQSLSFLVSDLWLENTEIKTSGAVALAEPLRKILAGGRSIAVYGVAAPYRGKIYDLPSRRDVSIDAKRPLFMLAVGPVDRLTEFDRALPRSPSRFLSAGVQSGAIKHSLFTLTPGAGVARSAAPFTGFAPGAGVVPGVVMSARRGVQIQRLVVRPPSGGAALSGSPEPDAQLPRWSGPQDDGTAPGAVWRGPIATKTLVWKLSRDDRRHCDAADWLPWGRFTGGWTPGPGPDRATFALRPTEIAANLGKADVYLITGQVIRTSLLTPNPADEWMRNWSFSADEEAQVVGASRPVFPTLNLSETARLLENVLADAAERSPTVVGGFSVVIKLER